MKSQATNRISTALFLAGGFHSSANVSGPKVPIHPPAISVETWNGQRWVTTRQVWNETEQRYRVAA